MTKTQIINKLNTDIESLQEEYDSLVDVICTHVICPECAEKNKEIAKQRELLAVKINERSEILEIIKTL